MPQLKRALFFFMLGSAAAAQVQIPITKGSDLPDTSPWDNTVPQLPQLPVNTTKTAPLSAQELDPSQPTASFPVDQDTEEVTTEPLLPWLITSPYTSQPHLTNLSSLALTSKLLALALTRLEPVDDTYAVKPYQDALNWHNVFQHLKTLSKEYKHTWQSTVFYVVEFRSKLKPNIDRDLLFKLDQESHREATASGGLLKYWFGRTSDDSEGRNLATCLWRAKEDAVAGGKGPWHKKARGIIPRMYESISVKGLRLTVEDNVSHWRFEPWVEES